MLYFPFREVSPSIIRPNRLFSPAIASDGHQLLWFAGCRQTWTNTSELALACSGSRKSFSIIEGSYCEHLVLDTLESIKGVEPFFWRDKQHREIDFVVPKGQTKIYAIECKWSVSAFDPSNLQVFRKNYSQGINFVVSPEVTKGTSFRRRYSGLEIHFVPLGELRGLLA